MYNLLFCPICHKALKLEAQSLKCENGHSFDIAKSGYVNLLKPGKKNNAKAGDSKEMISARSAFFASEAYSKIRDMICSIALKLNSSFIVDAGCGEGYYTNGIAICMPKSSVIGFDMSKFGCESASKTAKRMRNTNALFSVASIFDMPLDSESADLIINMFAPVAENEFHRVLKRDGYLIVVASGKEHLDGLKEALYDEVYLNDADEPRLEKFALIERKSVKYNTKIEGNDTIKALFTMTPYYHRTSLSDKARLDSLDSLETTVEADFFIFKKI
ncbi:MAG: methyltransferase domain-containing protein [Ruminococcaceae bacterium]|nr:methyltransferase domain-containing protein [Oscillospiraceae bacterium]